MRRLLVFATLLLMLHSCSSIPLLQFRGRAEGKATNPLGDLLQNRSIIFIGGLHRSGTSFLNYLIGSNPEASTFYGTNVPENEGQHLQRVYPSDQRVLFDNLVLDPAVQCGIQKDIFPGARREMSWKKGYFTHSLFASAQLGHLTESSSLITQPNRQKLLESWQLHWDFKRQMLVEKTPANIIRTRFLQEMFGSERSQFLLTMRHPLTQVSPELDCNYFAHVKEYFQQFVLTWYYWVPLDIVHLAKSTIFRYEDLAKDPLGAAADLYEALGLPPHQPELLMPEPTTTRKLLIFHGTAGVNQGTSFHPEARDGWVKNWQDIRSQCPNILETLIPFEKYLKPFGYSLYEPFILPTDLSGLFPGIDIQTSHRRSPQGPLTWKPSHSTLEDRILHHTLNSELLSC